MIDVPDAEERPTLADYRRAECDLAGKHRQPIYAVAMQDGSWQELIGLMVVQASAVTRLNRCAWCGWRRA